MRARKRSLKQKCAEKYDPEIAVDIKTKILYKCYSAILPLLFRSSQILKDPAIAVDITKM